MGGISSGLQNAGMSDRPLRLADSPQHYASGPGSNAPTPRLRRKGSNASSNHDTYSPELQRLERSYMGSNSTFAEYGSSNYTTSTNDHYSRVQQESPYLSRADYR